MASQHAGRLAAFLVGALLASLAARASANSWELIHSEDSSGGKTFSRAIMADHVDRLYLWGTGGEKPARNVFLRYTLESLDPADPKWLPAFPQSRQSTWTAEKFPPFRIWGQNGPDGLKYDEGPRLQCVGGFHYTNRVRWWDFDGVARPSPIFTFNMACWDSKRNRILYYSDGCTFTLDPTTNTANPWHLSLVGTPVGVFAACQNKLYSAKVDGATGHIQWELTDPNFPAPREPIRYHYEFQPLLHDTKQDRLVQLKGDANRVDVYARSLTPDGNWQQLETTGSAAIGREAIYIPRHDTILWLGDKQLFSLDCQTNRMEQLEIELPAGLYTHECAFVYDPRHDVCVALIPSRFSGPMQTFLYRFDPAGAKQRE